MATLSEIADEYPTIREVLEGPHLHTEAVTRLSELGVETSETAVRRFRAKIKWVRPEPEEDETPLRPTVRADEDPDGLTVYHDSWPVQLGEDYAPLIEFFGYDPQHFYVDDNGVKMSKWQQSKGNKNGSRDVIWLYSYKIRLKRIKEPITGIEDLDEAVKRINKIKPIKRTLGIPMDPIFYVHQQGDEQIGKSEGGGIAGVTRRIEDTLQRTYDNLKAELKTHPNIVGILDVANGDTVENIFGHYPSQQRTTETLRKQFQAGRNLDIQRTRGLAEFGLPITKKYVTDNHGEMRQSIGMAPFTSESDNLGLILAESVRDVLTESNLADLLTFLIPHDEWWTLLPDAFGTGLNIATGHGHKAKGTTAAWVKSQRDYLHFHHGFKAHLALLGHKHHFYLEDISGTTVIQTPSLDGGSDYFTAGYGNTSKSGAVAYLAGPQFNQYFTNLVVL
jgi:hypothetical protein